MKSTLMRCAITALVLSFCGIARAQTEQGVRPVVNASQVVEYLSTYYGSQDDAFKADVFRNRGRVWAEKTSGIASNLPDSGAFMLLFDSRDHVPDNITDSRLHNIAGKCGCVVTANVGKVWNRVPEQEIWSLGDYPPQQCAYLVQAIALPWFTRGKLPVGATGITWASMSLYGAHWDINMSDLAKRSAVVKLLAEQGLLTIPESTEMDFAYSGRRTVTIDLGTIVWTADDIPELESLSTNQYWSVLATQELQKLRP